MQARVRVLRMAAEGQAIAKAGGSDRVIFVPYGVPGDELTVEVSGEKQNYAQGRIVRVERPGADRVAPPCKYHFLPGPRTTDHGSRWCGGCDWQQFGYESALRLKREVVVDCLKRIGRLPDAPVTETLGSPEQTRYRNKVQVPFNRRDGKIIAGFYHPGSHDIVDFDDCLVQPELSVRIVMKVKELAATLNWEPYDSKTHSGLLRHLFVRTNRDGKALVAFVMRVSEFPGEGQAIKELRAAFPEIASIQQNVQPDKTSVILGPRWRKLWGADRLEERIGTLRLTASPGAFLQVNTGATEVLYDAAEALLLSGGFKPNTLLDLYSGVGSIALWMAPKVGKVLGVEEVESAVTDAAANAERNGIKNARFIHSTTESYFRSKQARLLPKGSAAIFDPPRSGVEPHVLRAVARSGVERIVYVSCNPATFARDARVLTDLGFELVQAQPVDLFPQTSHVELAALFVQTGG